MKIISLQTEAIKEAKAKNVRAAGKVPCVVYGNDVDHTQFACDYSELYRTYAKAGESNLVELDIAGKKVPVLFYELQFEPVSDAIIHVDFFAVDMKKEIEARVPVHFSGESNAVKDLGGVLVTVMDHVLVKCLPTALPSYLEVNIAKIESFNDAVTVADIVLPAGVTISDDADSMLATVQEPRREAVAEDVVEAAVKEVDGEKNNKAADDKKKE